VKTVSLVTGSRRKGRRKTLPETGRRRVGSRFRSHCRVGLSGSDLKWSGLSPEYTIPIVGKCHPARGSGFVPYGSSPEIHWSRRKSRRTSQPRVGFMGSNERPGSELRVSRVHRVAAGFKFGRLWLARYLRVSPSRATRITPSASPSLILSSLCPHSISFNESLYFSLSLRRKKEG
jgi:hypothetical protein